MKNILVKGSGDVTDSLQFFNFVVEKARDNYVVVICGGGTKISAALEKAGYVVEYDELGRRVTKTWEERMIMRDVLEHEEKRLQDKFVGKGVIVVPPILYAGSALCPINGDDLVKAYYLGFDEIYVFTKEERVEKKQAVFQEWPKVEIVGI
ncbi:hypothetical protein KJ763_00335 [Patescibacteria group bacterium]|nr:hypothetical protein [Patescibacteria group bacterium]